MTSMSLRAERLRERMARAAGSSSHTVDRGLSPARVPRDPELTNRFAIWAMAAGVFSVFISAFFVASTAALVLCWLSRRRSAELASRGKQPWGRRRTTWAFWFAVFGVAQYCFQLFAVPLLS